MCSVLELCVYHQLYHFVYHFEDEHAFFLKYKVHSDLEDET